MKHTVWRWLAISSVVTAAILTRAETRPQYGGTLRVAMRAAPVSLDPADSAQADSFAQRSMTLLMFETLVRTDDNGHVQACLADTWQEASSRRRWQFHLRKGVKLHDGSALTPEVAAASLRSANPAWRVSAEPDAVVIESTDAELLRELALSRNAIAVRNTDNKPIGSGPFQIVDWQPGKKLTLAANESYWGGRPFLEGIEIEMGRSYHDQLMELQLGRADLVEVAPEQMHRSALDSRAAESSAPVELMALAFTHDAQTPEEKSLRQALALSVDRISIRNVLLQGAGQPAGGLLPNWMSGYEFVFPSEANLAAARQAREQAHAVPSWNLACDSNDPLARLVAERIILNARDAGLSMRLASGSSPDVRLMRIGLPSADPWVALSAVAAATGLTIANERGDSISDLYAAEEAILQTQRVVPLFHLPVSYASAPRLRDWMLRADGTWNVADAWLGNGVQ
ncbi:MAG TPA: ABC transporter substrate-binding protein [Verrucomicrobiae bacterium]|nr:ABC transporter substrate-binding protein [Verrucomicrobiae bacterium]